MSLEQPTLPSPSPSAYLPPSSPPAQMEPTTTATSPTHANTTTSSISAPEFRSPPHLPPPSIEPTPSLDSALAQSSRSASSEALPSPLDASSIMQTDGDFQIIEALRSKDRLYVLKLGEQMESLINERRPRIDLTPATSYQRMLVHKCSVYYKLTPETDQTSRSIYVYLRSESRIPARRICELVPAEESAQPAIKIMRRSPQDRSRIRHNSQPGSVAGDDADLSDIEPSETGSIGGRSNATGINKRHRTIEEREAAYNEARSRIFGFEEEKEKEKDMSANSSTFSLSGSGSTSGGRSSMGDADDSASSAATESEWSGPVNRDKRDGRRGGSVTSSSRSLRSSDHVYSAPNGSGSSRNSRATSPTFTYASLAPNTPSYEPSYGPQEHPPSGFTPYYYSYPPHPPTHGPIPGQPYVAPYPYYPSYPYPNPPPPQPPTHHSDPTSPAGGEQPYLLQHNPPHPAQYTNPYPWSQSTPPGHPPYQPQTSPAGFQTSPQGPPPPLQHPNPSQPPAAPYAFMSPGHYPPYPGNGFYPPSFHPGQHFHSPTPPHVQGTIPFFPPEFMQSRDTSSMSLANGNSGGYGVENSNHSRASSRNSNSHTGTNGVGRRSGPRTRTVWPNGPGVGIGGQHPSNMVLNDTVGPRLSNRRTSGTSSGSGSNGNKTPGDEASSTASSSTTSSSSRRTFTSTSSKHPLPARPDWAVGIKALPGLHPPRSHEHSNPHSRTMSPARMGGQPLLNNQHPNQNHQPTSLQATDFPPLSSGSEKRPPPPSAGGAWTNPSIVRSVMMAGPQGNANVPAPGNALVHYPNSSLNMNNTRLDDQDRGFERPPPKNPELFNPKGVVRKLNLNRASPVTAPPVSASTGNLEKEKVGMVGGAAAGEEEKVRLPVDGTQNAATSTLVDKFAAVTLGVDGFTDIIPASGVVAPIPVSLIESVSSGAAGVSS